MAGYANAYTTVGTKPTTVFSVKTGGGVVVQNNGRATVYLGGSAVAASGTHKGFALRAGAVVFVPTAAGETNKLYGIVASGTVLVGTLYPV